MKLSLVVAMGENREIGAQGDLLWHLPADMAHFKTITLGHHVLMGRKTWESIPPRFRPLPGRTNLILSRTLSVESDQVFTFPSADQAIAFAENRGEKELMVIGGGAVYEELLPFCHTLYLTRVAVSFSQADTFFPKINEGEWEKITDTHYVADDRNLYAMRFQQWVRKE